MNYQQIVEQDKIQNVTISESRRVLPPYGQSLAQRSTAVLHRCQGCEVWWGSSQGYSPSDHQVFRLAEPHTDRFLWEDYRGWRNGAESDNCPECGEKVTGPEHTL
jgi:hypothetical protein